MHIFGNTIATSGGHFVHRHVGKIILYMYYKTNLCHTFNITRLTIMNCLKYYFNHIIANSC